MLGKQLRQIRLWQFCAVTFFVTQILYGVEGWPVWGVSAIVAWLLTRNELVGEKNFLPPSAVWLVLMFIMYLGRVAP